MGTLTGNVASRSDHCIHKLPTSCRLTASGTCCACQDKRVHANAYSTYVDGIGVMNSAPRWYRYCFFCKTFWSNRIALTEPNINPRETRIPEYPDQSEFLRKWHNYHQGFETVHNPSTGESERKTIICELPWRDVDPGYLPVRSRAEQITINRCGGLANEQVEAVSIEATLDDLLETAEDEDATEAPPQLRSTANIQRAAVESQSIIEPIQTAVDQALGRLNDAVDRLRTAEARQEQAATELRNAQEEVRSFQRLKASAARQYSRVHHELRMRERRESHNQRAAQRMARIFGSREEIEQAGINYVSPIAGMFTRAYERLRIADEVREQDRLATRIAADQGRQTTAERYQPNTLEENEVLQGSIIEPHRGSGNMSAAQPSVQNVEDSRLQQFRTLDDDSSRPPPMSDQDMTIKLHCRICLQQRADTAVLPCGHLVMCAHCADIWIPTRKDNITAIGRPTCCLCRAGVKRVARIYTA